ncbi:ATPase [Fusobacterium hominis]|uniref:ATPase n=1 Tax=Fusobacterium hominis TaxID=2764326 RepID=A0A7G9GVV4_9FUSO|nr:ATPase [Fusobacterium hominis]QNM14936.1 ATPase [Fusobacterium hominis]
MIKDIISNEDVKEFFSNELKRDKNSGTYLFYGSDMTLLMEFAIYFAKGLCCETLDGDFCNSCSTCKRIDSFSYSDLEILDNPDGITVDQVRSLGYVSSSSSYEGSRKIFIIKDISKMKKEAGNALLKIIEEPNNGSFFILLNTNLNILPTIKSRSIIVKIKKRSAEELGVDKFTYDFFRGNNEDIKKFKELNIDLQKGYSYMDIGKAIKHYSDNEDLESKINIYKGLRDFVNNRNYLADIDKIYFAEEIVRNSGSRNILRDIISYTVEILGDIQGLQDRLQMKKMMRAPINMKLFFINFFLKI